MHNRHFIVVGVALGISLCQATWAFSGGLDAAVGNEDGPLSLPAISAFEDHPRDAESHGSADGSADSSSSEAVRRPAEHRSSNQQFQRYFDRHYRAHLALDAAEPHKANIE